MKKANLRPLGLLPMIVMMLMALCAISCHEGLKERASREAREFTRKNCPQKLPNGLQLDSLVFEEGDSTLHQYYSATGSADTLQLYVDKRQEIRKGLLDGIRNDLGNKTFKEAGFNYQITIFSAKRAGQMLFDVRFTQKDY